MAAAVGHRAAAVGHRAAAVGHRAAAVGHRAAAVGHRAAAVGHRAAAVGHRAAAVGHRAAAVGHRAAAVAPLRGAHLRVRRARLQVGEHAARLGAVAAAGGRVDGAQHREVRPVLAAVLAALHLAVDDAGVLAGAVHVVHLRHVARLLRDARPDTCRIHGHMAGFTLWLVLSPLANFTENWLNNCCFFWARFRQFYKDSRRNRVTMANLAELILMLV